MFPIKILFLHFIFVLFCMAQEDENRTPYFRRDYIFLSDQNAFYKFHRIKRKWSSALDSCTAEGAELFVPKSKQELESVMKISQNNQLWIAAHDMFSDGDFITLDGRPFSESYVKWRPGEPNNLNQNEHCVIVETIAEYTDVPCDHEHNSICKRSNQNLTQNLVCETYDTEYVYTSQTDRCYKFHTNALTWHQAYKTCKAEESNLVIINSETEAKILTLMFAKYPERTIKGTVEKGAIFLGFNDLISNGIYLTIEGQTLNVAGYDNWATGQPDNHQGVEHCGSMFRDGTLNDLNCKSRAMFVCEKVLSTSYSNPISSVAKLPDDQ